MVNISLIHTMFPSILGLPSPHVPTKQTLTYSLLCQQTPDYVQTKRPNIPRQRTSGLCASLLSQSTSNLHGMETESIVCEF
jgi:hypothetical protein